MVTVASFYCDRREDYPDAVDYIPLLGLLQASCDKFGHRHVVISDKQVSGFETHVVPLPRDLMLAILFGQRDWIARGCWQGHTVMVGADCLINRDLNQAFTPGWDICITTRKHRRWPVNTGAIYLKGGMAIQASNCWAKAAALCNGEWGDDQAQIATQFAPIPETHRVEQRGFMYVSFASMKTHNDSPKHVTDDSDAFVVHFKGKRKSFMADWAKQHLGIAA
jgi:hypothetical protein